MKTITNSKSKVRSYYIKHELLGKWFVTFFGILLIALTVSLVIFISSRGLSIFVKNHLSPLVFLFSANWNPERAISDGGPAIGALIFIVGSISISFLALLISTPFSISTAIFMSEISPNLGKKFLQPAIEIFVGIPSVVYGWIGLSLLVPFIRTAFGGLGFSLLAGGLVLAVMIFPTIASVSVEALRSLPGDYREASLALGATRWQTIRRVLIPASLPGILTGVVLGLARAFGEALAVQMVIGNSSRIAHSLLEPTINLTSIITMDMGNTAMGSVENNALWSMAFLLLLISFVFIIIIRRIGVRGSTVR
jgi:phosphate transport system permease protein